MLYAPALHHWKIDLRMCRFVDVEEFPKIDVNSLIKFFNFSTVMQCLQLP